MVNKRADLAELIDNKPFLLEQLQLKGYTALAEEWKCFRQSLVWASKDFTNEQKASIPYQRKGKRTL